MSDLTTDPATTDPGNNGSDPEPDGDSRRVGAYLPDADPAKAAERRSTFQTGLDEIRSGGSLVFSEKVLLIVGGIIAPIGLIIVLLGWYGASRTPYLFEQIPYMISGGLFGLALVFLGAFFYFTHWLTELVKEGRSQNAALMDAIGRLQASIEGDSGPAEVIITEMAGPPTELVATERGTMAHRRDCTVVTGKSDLRSVTAEEGLPGCKLCDPYVDLEQIGTLN